jgi:hypothetical protein
MSIEGKVSRVENSMSRFGLTRTLAACAVMLATTSADAAVLSRIERYCTVSWQNAGIAPQDWVDCTQDAFVELLERISRDRWSLAVESPTSEERRELNRSVWCIVKRWQRAPRPKGLELDVTDRHNDHLSLLPEEWSALVREANLSKEQTMILDLSRQGDAVAEIARNLELPAARVSDQKFKAIQRLRQVAGSEA